METKEFHLKSIHPALVISFHLLMYEMSQFVESTLPIWAVSNPHFNHTS